MHILIAPNAFKNSLNATDAANAISKGLLQSNLSCTCECFGVGDGGDGTVELMVNHLHGTWQYGEVLNANGQPIDAAFGLIDEGKTAVIEMANAAGLRLLKTTELNPLSATSYGTGQQIKAALDKGVQKIIVGMGGSATVDGGVGILRALGIKFFNASGNELTTLPADLVDLATIDTSGLDERIGKTEIVVMCDVENELLGANGSAAVFGPQKGATASDVEVLENALSKLSTVAFHQTQKNMAAIQYGGTAGGAAAGLYAFLNARLVNGIEYFLQVTGFSSALAKAKLVITGEGSIDEQTLHGKGPFGVARLAKQHNVPVVGLAGKVPLHINPQLHQYFDVLLPINNEITSIELALTNTALNLERTAFNLGNILAAAQ